VPDDLTVLRVRAKLLGYDLYESKDPPSRHLRQTYSLYRALLNTPIVSAYTLEDAYRYLLYP
jgi:hypothetical protein